MSHPKYADSPLVWDNLVQQEIYCIHCGHNLRGQKTFSRCRSCNTLVRKSLHLGLMMCHDHRGLRLLRIAFFLVGLATLFTWLPAARMENDRLLLVPQPMLGVVLKGVGIFPESQNFASYQSLLMLLPILFLTATIWLLTAANFPITSHHGIKMPTFWVRLLVALPLIGFLLVTLGETLHLQWVSSLGTILTISLIFTVLVVWSRLRDLVLLLHHARLAFFARLVRWLMIGCYSLSLFFVLGSLVPIHWIIGVSPDQTPGPFALILPLSPIQADFFCYLIQYLLTWPLVVLCGLSLLTMFWFVQEMNEAIGEAREAPHDVQPNQSM